jgi:lysophospholipase L1-like esterase
LAGGLIKRGIVMSAMFVAVWLLAEAPVIWTGLLVPADFADRHRVLFEMFEPHREWGFHTRPNLREFRVSWRETGVQATYSTDEYGFRNVGRDYDAARVAFLGDSFTFGVWVEERETFPSLIGKALDVPLLNLGQQSFYVEQYSMVLDWLLERHAPDVVVVAIFPNDFTAEMTADDFAHFYERFGWDAYRSMPWQQRSMAFGLVRLLHSPAPTPQALQSGRTRLGLMLFREAGAHPRYLQDGMAAHVEQVVTGMVERAGSRGVRLVLALLPSKESTYVDDYDRLFDGDYLENERVGYERLTQAARQAGAVVADLTGVFRAHADERLYFEYDAHFNAAGQALTAATLEPAVAAAFAQQ